MKINYNGITAIIRALLFFHIDYDFTSKYSNIIIIKLLNY